MPHSSPVADDAGSVRTVEEGDDGVLHEFWALPEEDIEALEPYAAAVDPGAGKAVAVP